MSLKVDWSLVARKVFNKENLIAIVAVGCFPPIIGTIRAFSGLDPIPEGYQMVDFGIGFIYSYIVTATLFYGSAAIIHILNQVLPWKGNVQKRIFLEIIFILSFSSTAQGLILYLLDGTPLLFIKTGLEFKDYVENILFSNAITIIVVILMEGIYFFRNWRETILATERLMKENAESQLANLRSQLDPHFLFNSLNVLTGLIRQDPKKAETFVEDFARVYRHMLEVNNRMVVPLEEELDFAKQYLRLQQIRFKEGLQVYWNLEAMHADSYLPPLSLQELISNAIKHNVVHESQPLVLDIEVGSKFLEVRNTYNLRSDQRESTGLGLENIRERYRLLQQKEPEFSQKNGLYIARLALLEIEE